MNHKKVIGTLCVLGTTFGYALIPPLSFLAFEAGVATETLLFDKFFLAAILMWAYLLLRKVPFKLTKATVLPILIVVISYIGVATTLYLAYDYISGSLATIISYMFPAFVVAVEIIRKQEPVSSKKIAAVALSFTGLCFIVGMPGSNLNVLGILFALLCAVCYSFYVLGLANEKLERFSSLAVAGYVLASSAVFNFLRCIFSGQPLFVTGVLPVFYIVILAVFCAFAAIMLFCIGVKLLGPGNASLIETLEPALACFMCYILIDDKITPGMMIGGILIVMAVLLTSLPAKSAESAENKIKKQE